MTLVARASHYATILRRYRRVIGSFARSVHDQTDEESLGSVVWNSQLTPSIIRINSNNRTKYGVS